MKGVVLLSLLFALQGGIKRDYISIEYAGDSEKSLFVICLSSDSIPRLNNIVYFEYSSPETYYIINKQDLKFVKKEITSTPKKPFEDKDYHGFKVTIRERGSMASYFILHKNATRFFNDLIAHFKRYKKDNELVTELTAYKYRINR